MRGKRQAQEQNGGASRPPHAVPAFLALFRAVYVSNFFSFSKFIFSFPAISKIRSRALSAELLAKFWPEAFYFILNKQARPSGRMLSFKRQKKCGLARVSTLSIPYLGQPKGLCCLPDGSLLATTLNKVAFCFPMGPLPCTFLAGRDHRGFLNGNLTEASFDKPSGLLLRANGDIVVVDTDNNALRLMRRDVAKDMPSNRHMLTTLAGTRDAYGFADGLAVDNMDERQASFNGPSCAVLLPCGSIAILDTGNHALRVLTTAGKVSTLAGNGEPGFMDGLGSNARFLNPCGLAFSHRQGCLIVSDSGNHAIRMVCLMGTVTTIAGMGVEGFRDGRCRDALFSYPSQVVVDGAGRIVVADTGNNRIRVVERTENTEEALGATPLAPMTTHCVRTLVGGQNVVGPMSAQRVDGEASAARFKDPTTLALDYHGRLLVAEKNTPDQIRIVDVGLQPPVCFYDVDPNIELMQSRGNALLRALDDLSKLADDPENADVVFVVQGERFPAHRVIVSRRCAYLSNMLKFHGARNVFVLEDVGVSAFRVMFRYFYSAEMRLFPESEVSRRADGLDLDSTALAREVLMCAEKWGVDELYQHFVHEFKRTLTVLNCAEALAWATTKGTVETVKVARAFFLKHRREVAEDARPTLDVLKCLAPEQAHEILLAVLLD